MICNKITKTEKPLMCNLMVAGSYILSAVVVVDLEILKGDF